MPLRRSNINEMEKNMKETLSFVSLPVSTVLTLLLTHHSSLFQFKIKPQL